MSRSYRSIVDAQARRETVIRRAGYVISGFAVASIGLGGLAFLASNIADEWQKPLPTSDRGHYQSTTEMLMFSEPLDSPRRNQYGQRGEYVSTIEGLPPF